MKRNFIFISTMLMLFIMQRSLADGLFFNVIAGGVPANLSVILCLDGNAPLSCQNYPITALSLSINSTVPNHTYPNAGIKVNTSGYTLAGCTLNSQGYCLFSVSDTTAATISISPN